MYYWEYFPRARPRPAPKAGKAGKKFGNTWWGKKWVGALSKYEYDQRMSRGRAYARADLVSNFKITPGCISAKVQGSSKYSITINFKKYTDKEWGALIGKMRETPILISKLLNNELPEEMEKICKHSLVPSSFDADCSCPDYANPCKHIAAVFYTIADEIDYDPMILFNIRGMHKDELICKLGLAEEDKPETIEKKVVVKREAKKKIGKKPAAKKKQKRSKRKKR